MYAMYKFFFNDITPLQFFPINFQIACVCILTPHPHSLLQINQYQSKYLACFEVNITVSHSQLLHHAAKDNSARQYGKVVEKALVFTSWAENLDLRLM